MYEGVGQRGWGRVGEDPGVGASSCKNKYSTNAYRRYPKIKSKSQGATNLRFLFQLYLPGGESLLIRLNFHIHDTEYGWYFDVH